jgi:polyketide biosynthesis acyl carrier protein
MAAADVSRQQIELMVRDVISTVLPSVPAGAITADSHLQDLGADSVDRVEIILMLLDRLHIDEPMSRFNRIPDVGALVTFLDEKCR